MYEDFKLKRSFGLHGLYKHNSALEGLNNEWDYTINLFNLSHMMHNCSTI